jgi:putative DNA primase/helicase
MTTESASAAASQYRPVTSDDGTVYIDDSITAGKHSVSFGGEQAPSPWSFFDGRGAGLLMNALITWTEKAGPIAAGPGRSVWRYSHGVWMTDGESEVVRRVRVLLGDRFRRTHAQAAVDIFANRQQFIGVNDSLWGKVNVANGILDWTTKELKPHDPRYPFVWQLPVAWNPSAECSEFDSWLHQVFPGTTDTQPSPGHTLAYEILGYALLGTNLLHKAVILHGGGRNGKGTYLRILTALLGNANTSSVSLQAIAADKYATAELFGKLANVMGDLDGSAIRYTDRLKQLTGGDEVYAQRKYEQPFKFVATAFPIFAANDLPSPMSDFSEGFFSRWMIVPFSKGYFPEGTADPYIETRLLGELEGILVRAVTALRDLAVRRSFTQLEEVTGATASYRENSDPVLAFIQDRIRPVSSSAKAWISRRDVYVAYEAWCSDSGRLPLSARKFYQRFARLYRVKFGKGLIARKRQTDGYLDVMLVPEEETIEPIGSTTWGDLLDQAEFELAGVSL